MIIACLHNHPPSRPSAVEVLSVLQKLQVEQKATLQKFQLEDYVLSQTAERSPNSSKVHSLLDRIRVRTNQHNYTFKQAQLFVVKLTIVSI